MMDTKGVWHEPMGDDREQRAREAEAAFDEEIAAIVARHYGRMSVDGDDTTTAGQSHITLGKVLLFGVLGALTWAAFFGAAWLAWQTVSTFLAPLAQ